MHLYKQLKIVPQVVLVLYCYVVCCKLLKLLFMFLTLLLMQLLFALLRYISSIAYSIVRTYGNTIIENINNNFHAYTHIHMYIHSCMLPSKEQHNNSSIKVVHLRCHKKYCSSSYFLTLLFFVFPSIYFVFLRKIDFSLFFVYVFVGFCSQENLSKI